MVLPCPGTNIGNCKNGKSNSSQIPTQNSIDSCENCNNCNDNKTINLQLHKVDLADILFNEENLNKDINKAISQYELITKKEEFDFPQCANCKYKDIFFKEQQMKEVKEELNKIAQLQEQESLKEQALSKNVESVCENLQSLNQDITHFEIGDSDNFTQDISYLQKEEEQSLKNEKDLFLNDENGEEQEIQTTPYYFGLIQNQYEDMFIKYPAFEKLSNIIDDSKWIKVDGVEEPYIMGIIYKDEIPQYLCYGVLQEKKQNPPVDMLDSCQWVPFDIDNEFGQGAWILYQSAENGETLKVVVE